MFCVDPPAATLELASYINPEDIREQMDIRLTCHVTANPQPANVTWLFEGVKIETTPTNIHSTSKTNPIAILSLYNVLYVLLTILIAYLSWSDCYPGDRLRTDLLPRVIQSSTGILIRRIQRVHRGRYMCQAENSQGRGTSNEIYLKLKCESMLSEYWMSLL